jgi:hypothetical protein
MDTRQDTTEPQYIIYHSRQYVVEIQRKEGPRGGSTESNCVEDSKAGNLERNLVGTQQEL